jgi:hypothetical protein
MSSFTVTPESLDALQHAVLGLAAELDSGPTALALAPSSVGVPASRAGAMYGSLNGGDDPLGYFLNCWEHSLGEIGENMVRVARALGTAAERYSVVDNNVIPGS